MSNKSIKVQSNQRKPRKDPVTSTQVETLETLLLNNEKLVQRKFSGKLNESFTFKDYQNGWQKITDTVNKLGPEKTVKEWQKHWNDRKSRLKRRQAEIRASQASTGGGPPSDDELDPTEEKLIKLMGGEVCISGHTHVKEAGLPRPQPLQNKVTNSEESMKFNFSSAWTGQNDSQNNYEPVVEWVSTDQTDSSWTPMDHLGNDIFLDTSHTTTVEVKPISMETIESMTTKNVVSFPNVEDLQKTKNLQPTLPHKKEKPKDPNPHRKSKLLSENSTELLTIQQQQIQIMKKQLIIQKRMATSKKRKNNLFQRQVVAMERDAKSKEDQAAALQKIASCLQKLCDKSKNS